MKKTKPTHTPGQLGTTHSIDAAVLRKEWETADREALREIVRKQKETVSALLAALEALLGTQSDKEIAEHDDPGQQWHDAETCALCMARAAVLKARGK